MIADNLLARHSATFCSALNYRCKNTGNTRKRHRLLPVLCSRSRCEQEQFGFTSVRVTNLNKCVRVFRMYSSFRLRFIRMNLRIVAQPEYFLLPCLLAYDTLHHERRSGLQDGLSSDASTASLRDSVVVLHLVTWSGQRNSGRPLGRLYDEGGVAARMSVA